MLASHIVGAFWYLLAVERRDTCWQELVCTDAVRCNKNFLYCGNQRMDGYDAWASASGASLQVNCSADGSNGAFDFGIYQNALSSDIVSSMKFISKYCYCLWWGLQNLR
uniref:Putative cyclic nucleotide-gated ion channel 5 n=1 Tax=Rhizophora mucronata TaxID=61149 RepID=A0A2P2MAI5_RHIMU